MQRTLLLQKRKNNNNNTNFPGRGESRNLTFKGHPGTELLWGEWGDKIQMAALRVSEVTRWLYAQRDSPWPEWAPQLPGPLWNTDSWQPYTFCMLYSHFSVSCTTTHPPKKVVSFQDPELWSHKLTRTHSSASSVHQLTEVWTSRPMSAITCGGGAFPKLLVFFLGNIWTFAFFLFMRVSRVKGKNGVPTAMIEIERKKTKNLSGSAVVGGGLLIKMFVNVQF